MAEALVAANLRARLAGAWAIPSRSRASCFERVNHALWTGSAGDQYASLVSALIDPARGRLLLGTAGTCLALLVGEQGFESLVESSLPIGRQPAGDYAMIEREMAPGDVLLLASGTNLDLASPSSSMSGLEALGRAIDENRDRGVGALVEIAREFFLGVRAGKNAELSIAIAQHRKRRRPKCR